MRVWTSSQQGLREYQQDLFYSNPKSNLYAVIDGMGGHANGELASQSICDHLHVGHKDVSVKELLKQADRECSSHRDGRGAVATVLQLKDGTGHITHAGDTRCYHFTPEEEILRTIDHAGWGGSITNFIGGKEFRQPVTPTGNEFAYTTGDIILLTSDGTHWDFSPIVIATVIRQAIAEQINPAEALTDYAIARGSTDNCTALVLEIV